MALHQKYNTSSFFRFLFIPLILIGNTYAFTQSTSDKIKGMSYRGPYDPHHNIKKVENVRISNAEWIAFVPESTLDRTTLTLLPDHHNDFWSESIEANIQGIQIAKRLGFKTFLKPHIILGELPLERKKDKTHGAEWRGDLLLKKEADWKTFESSYENYILRLAHIADSLNVDLFCVGTELKNSTLKRPLFWNTLIQKVRTIYKGPITYSANWDEYQKVPFWKQLDYISVNTYFPVSWKKTPKVKKTIRKWKSIRRSLKKIARKENRKIILSEFGYRNVNYAGRRPWIHDRQDNKSPNNQAQLNLYKAFFKSFWDQSWVAGGFCWQWFHKTPAEGNTTFSIQDKPALSVIQDWYGK